VNIGICKDLPKPLFKILLKFIVIGLCKRRENREIVKYISMQSEVFSLVCCVRVFGRYYSCLVYVPRERTNAIRTETQVA